MTNAMKLHALQAKVSI